MNGRLYSIPEKRNGREEEPERQGPLVAGATCGAGRGIACMLGEAGATVYCSGRSTRQHLSQTGYYAGRPETIDETAAMINDADGKLKHRTEGVRKALEAINA